MLIFHKINHMASGSFYTYMVLLLCTYAFCDEVMTYGSLTVVQVQDVDDPLGAANAYIVVNSDTKEGFMIDTGSTTNTTAKLIEEFQRRVQSTSKTPLFIYITHGHPDHTAGFWLLQRAYPTTPLYVYSDRILNEARQWHNLVCASSNNAAPRCQANFTNVLQVLKSPRTQLNFNYPGAEIDIIDVMVRAESTYATQLGLTLSSGVYLLFTGDIVTIRAHLFLSNFFSGSSLPDSDDALCAWGGYMRMTACNLKQSKSRSIIFPGHGPISGPNSYASDISRNIGYLRRVRNYTFNSCNATYVWSKMVEEYPDFGARFLGSIGSLGTHVPADANSVNCNCNNSLPAVCPVYNAPPTCVHLDLFETDTTLACSLLKKSGSSQISLSVCIVLTSFASLFF